MKFTFAELSITFYFRILIQKYLYFTLNVDEKIIIIQKSKLFVKRKKNI